MDEFDSCDGVEFMDGSGDSDNSVPRGPDFAHKWLFGVGDAGARGGGLGRHLVSPSSSSSVWNGRAAGCKDAPARPRVPITFLAVTQGDSTGGAVPLAGLGCGAALAV